jgi:hypothetical protein
MLCQGFFIISALPKTRSLRTRASFIYRATATAQRCEQSERWQWECRLYQQHTDQSGVRNVAMLWNRLDVVVEEYLKPGGSA